MQKHCSFINKTLSLTLYLFGRLHSSQKSKSQWDEQACLNNTSYRVVQCPSQGPHPLHQGPVQRCPSQGPHRLVRVPIPTTATSGTCPACPYQSAKLLPTPPSVFCPSCLRSSTSRRRSFLEIHQIWWDIIYQTSDMMRHQIRYQTSDMVRLLSF